MGRGAMFGQGWEADKQVETGGRGGRQADTLRQAAEVGGGHAHFDWEG